MSQVTSIKCRFLLKRPHFCLDVAFECPERVVTAIVGPSGSGKSTILRCMAGLERQARGEFLAHDTVWQSPSAFVAPHRRPFGFVFQQPNLFDHMNVAQNIDYGLLRLGMEAPERSRTIKTMARDLKIDHLLERNPATLSGGQQQRVALARALVLKPRILLMDEPLSGLDDDLKVEFLDLLQGLRQHFQMSIIYVSHAEWEVSRMAQHVIRLEHGKVTERLSSAQYATEDQNGLRIRQERLCDHCKCKF